MPQSVINQFNILEFNKFNLIYGSAYYKYTLSLLVKPAKLFNILG